MGRNNRIPFSMHLKSKNCASYLKREIWGIMKR